MSDKNNSDNQNTNTIYIPPEVRNAQQLPRLKKANNRIPPQQNQNAGQQYYQQQQYYGNGQQPYYPNDGQQYYQNGQYPPPQYYQDGQYPPPQQYYDYGYPEEYRDEPQRKRSGNSNNNKKKHKKKRKNTFFGRFITTLIVVFLLLFGMYSCTSIVLINKMDHVDTAYRNRRSDALSKSYVTNILIIGTDGRTESERGRSDTVMLASVNSRTNTISLISFMRDCYVEIPNYGWDRLNASYSYGGAELLMDTIEHNFGIAIDDYVSINFISFVNIVDSVGGIDVNISEAEANEINVILQAEVNGLMGDKATDDMIIGGGEHHLNGKQALAYARIRYIGNADFERTQRQREVVELVMNKMKTLNPSYFTKLSTSVLPGVTTNMSTAEMYVLSLQAPLKLGYDRQQLQVPAEGTYYGDTINGSSVLVVDFDSNYNIIYETAFDDE